MLVKEPSNVYDPNAIRVQKLDGTQLGYIPKELTPRFPQHTTFAHIHTSGQIPDGLYGCQVRVLPGLQP